MPQLFLDCDGVLADFEGGAELLLRMPPKAYQAKHGPGGFWKKLATAPDFYNTLALLPDAMELHNGVKHVDPIILTGLPIGTWAEPQKRAWAARHFPGVQVITTLARNKSSYCEPGMCLWMTRTSTTRRGRRPTGNSSCTPAQRRA